MAVPNPVYRHHRGDGQHCDCWLNDEKRCCACGYEGDDANDCTGAIPDAGRSSRLLSPDLLAAELHVTPKTLANWRYSGGGPPFVKVGRNPWYRRGDIDAWLEGRTFVRSHQPVRAS